MGGHIIDPRKGIPPAGQPQNPLTIGVDPQTGSVVLQHPVFGQQIVFSAKGVFGIRDKFGNFIQTTEDGFIEICPAIGIRMIGAINPIVMIDERKEAAIKEALAQVEKQEEEASVPQSPLEKAAEDAGV